VTELVRPLFRPLFRVDPGWPFVLAGLALLIAAIIIPAQRELHDLRNEQRAIDAQESRVYARLQAYDGLLADLQSGDPELVRRLSIAQLNQIPSGEQSFLLTPGMNQTVAQWIDESVPDAAPRVDVYPDTLLGRLAFGPNRLWMIAGAAFLLFVGLLLGPEESRGRPAMAGDRRAPDPTSGDPEGEAPAAGRSTDPAGLVAALGAVAVATPAIDETSEDGSRSWRTGESPREAASAADGDEASEEIIDVEVVEDAVEEIDRSAEWVEDEVDVEDDADADADADDEVATDADDSDHAVDELVEPKPMASAGDDSVAEATLWTAEVADEVRGVSGPPPADRDAAFDDRVIGVDGERPILRGDGAD
jgi:hypothetical protein